VLSFFANRPERRLGHNLFQEIQQNKIALDIIRQVRQTILGGKLVPGDRLPPEKELVAKFGVSKHSLREAFRALEAMGFLTIRKGSGGGAMVMEVDMDTTRDSIANFLYFQNVSVQDLSGVRKVFEPHLTQLAVERLSVEELDKLKHTHKCCLDAFALGENIYRHEIDFHRVLAQASGNPVFVLIQDFVNTLLGDLKRQLKPGLGFLKQVIAAHDRILEAVESRDPERARVEMYRHVCEVESGLEALRGQKRGPLKGRVKSRNKGPEQP
jgi:GntR family transcriptional repressor for pyruvate dehydrogenase complex